MGLFLQIILKKHAGSQWSTDFDLKDGRARYIIKYLLDLSSERDGPAFQSRPSTEASKVNGGFSTIVLMSLVYVAGLTLVAQNNPDTPKPPAETTNAPPAPDSGKPISERVGLAVDPTKYVIGPEDVLLVRTWREPDFTLVVVVRPDGKITMPLVGELQASNLTPQALTDSIREKLTQYIVKPDVSVFVEQVRSKKYYIQGEVGHSGFFPLVTPTTVLEALGNAGGFKEFANLKDIHILRNGKILHFNYKDVSKGKHLEQNIYVENGDQIIVR
jgi:polysaccharide export outer membrane protein